MASSGETQLQRIIRDMQDAVTELNKEFLEAGEPVTDDSIILHKFSYKLEYLLQFDQKEKSTLLGNRKDYWDYFCDCLRKVKGANDGIRFVKSISELRTSLGKGRAFIRYSLVHQRLADTLQQCFMNTKVTSDWYYARSPFLNPKLSSDIVGHLYELTEIQFDLASRGYDLDAGWPTFARRTLCSLGSSAYLWKPPSRSSSMSSLVSTSVQAQENLSSRNENSFFNTESLEGLEDLHMDLDRAELQQKELQDQIQNLEGEKQELQATISLQKQQVQMEREKNNSMMEENDRLKKMLGELEKQISHLTQGTIQEFQKCLETLELNAAEKQKECSAKLESLESLKNAPDSKIPLNQELKTMEIWLARKDLLINELTAKLKSAEKKTEELAEKANSLMDEKSHQAISQYDSVLKTELLKKLCLAEEEKADAQKLHSELLSHLKIMEEQFHVKEEKQKEFELKLKSLTISTKEESEKLLINLEAMTIERAELQEELAVKDKMVADFQIQLADTLGYVKSLEEKLQEERNENAEFERLLSHTTTSTMGQKVKNLMEHHELLKVQLAKFSDMVKSLEKQKGEVVMERDDLKTRVLEMEHQITKQCFLLRNSFEENENFKSQNTKQQQTYQKLKEKCNELDISKSFLEGEVARLTASEKHLQSQIDDAMIPVDEKEKILREKNKLLDENLQNATRKNQLFDEKLKALQTDYQELKQNENRTAEFLSVVQAELQNAEEHNLQMEKNLSCSRQSEESLKLQLTEKIELLEGLENQCSQLWEQAEEYRIKIETLEENGLHQAEIIESLTSEKISVDKTQLELVSCQEREAEDLTLILAISEEQQNISRVSRLISRLQEEIIEFQTKLQQTTAEKQKLQGKLDVTETVLSEQKLLSQQLKEQNETLNRNHVQELLQCKEEEKMQKNEWKNLAQQKAELEKNMVSLTDELSKVRSDLEVVNMENMEIKDHLQRTNMDMAELGIQICSLTSEKTEVEEKLSQVKEELRAIKEISIKEQERLQLELTRFSNEKQELQEKLEDSNVCAAIIPDLQTQLELAEKQTKCLQETSKEEVATVKFQLSTEILNYQTKFKALSEECEKLKEELEEQNRQANAAEEALKEMQAVKRNLHVQLNLSMDQVTEYKAIQQKKDEEIAELKEDLKRAQTEVSRTNEQIQDHCDKFNEMKSEQDNNEAKLLAELDDLTKTKKFLEEKLIELLRDKDALWQKSDALEFQQKLIAEQRWLGDAEVTCCLDCQKEFGWMNRRHHCRMCGRIFCYYCCNHYAVSKQTGKKERCCRACFKKVTANPVDSELNFTPEESPSSSLLASPLSLVRKILVTNETSKSTDDSIFDIITDEEVGQIQEGDSAHSKNQTEESLDHDVPDLNSSSTVDESDDLKMAQDAEICLLKSGEMMLKLPLTVEEILKFGEGTRELFIKSSTYSIIPITVDETGLTISWVFSSDPKSISFSAVYKQSEDTSLDQCKVLIPMTRCNSHKETIRGNVKVRNPGIYILIFDNTFSRFISKKVFFHLSVQRPVIYDGSDFP
ncbi:FYVE and coiled-coil domain-containing protein 1 [Protobothrops mucrosquamatus]|uniref:FYVE and coiled-coil domain-containing protein 1 n=1 Tax=Protobothrops mucrosquamatus TaxID=103944 RepID=UPI000775F5FC|nr:FYVE and coiled-coil domain-containing protein 1 [Protobothrops mucrosquamatus]